MRRIAAVGACLAMLCACRVGGLAFRVDERVEIVAPDDRTIVTLPFDVRWTVQDFEVTGPDGSRSERGGYFAVLLDLAPMPPGEDLTYFARDDQSCRPQIGCPDETYLADRGVHTTTQTTFEVTTLADTRPTDRPSAPDDHDVTIVLLNGKGERIGESAFRVEVTVDLGQS